MMIQYSYWGVLFVHDGLKSFIKDAGVLFDRVGRITGCTVCNIRTEACFAMFITPYFIQLVKGNLPAQTVSFIK